MGKPVSVKDHADLQRSGREFDCVFLGNVEQFGDRNARYAPGDLRGDPVVPEPDVLEVVVLFGAIALLARRRERKVAAESSLLD